MFFRAALAIAIRRRAKDLSADQLRLARAAVWSPRRRAASGEILDFEAIALDEGCRACAMPAVGAAEAWRFDWQTLLDWLIENLPKILELFATLLALFAEQAEAPIPADLYAAALVVAGETPAAVAA